MFKNFKFWNIWYFFVVVNFLENPIQIQLTKFKHWKGLCFTCLKKLQTYLHIIISELFIILYSINLLSCDPLTKMNKMSLKVVQHNVKVLIRLLFIKVLLICNCLSRKWQNSNLAIISLVWGYICQLWLVSIFLVQEIDLQFLGRWVENNSL